MKIVGASFGAMPTHHGERTKSGERRVLDRDFMFAFSAKVKGEEFRFNVRLVSGYDFDGASIPRWLWWLCGHPLETPREAVALAHDWLYESKFVTRAEADAIYRKGLCRLGFGKIKARIEWLALRLFGWTHYRGDADERSVALCRSFITDEAGRIVFDATASGHIADMMLKNKLIDAFKFVKQKNKEEQKCMK